MLALSLLIFAPPVRAAAPPRQDTDTLLITPTTQGRFTLPATGVTLEIGYASVRNAARLSVTRDDTPDGPRYTITASDSGGTALDRFEVPLIAHLPPGAGPLPRTAHGAGVILPATVADAPGDAITLLLGWPQTVTLAAPTPAPEPDAGRWLVVFDAHGLYALPAWDALPESIVYLGPLEGYTPDLLDHDLARAGLHYTLSDPAARAVLRHDARGETPVSRPLPTAARTARYAERFRPEDLRNPGGFALLGWAAAERLPDVARALYATIPDDPDLPAPGVPRAPLDLILPFDCAQTWVISWGYHGATPQNRFAVDFAAEAPGGALDQPVYAAHAGTLYFKRYGTPDHLIDVGLAARVVAADGVTSTVYGHLDPPGTLGWWDLDDSDLPDFAWVEVGAVAPGQLIALAGSTGYATGPHIHFALWAWDQSLYQPVPLGPLGDFPRGLRIPGAQRQDCARYHP